MVNYFFTLLISHNVILLPQNLSFFSLPKPQQSFVRDSSFWVSLQLYSVFQLVGSPCCHLPVVSTQVFRWNASVRWLYQIIDLLVLRWITTVSWVLTSLLLSVMSLVINTCYYFDLCSILSPSGAFTHRYFHSSSFKLIHISVKISVDEYFGSFSLVLTFIVFFFAVFIFLFPFSLNLLDPYYTSSLYGSSPKCIVSGILFIPVTDKFPSFHLIVPPDVLETFTWVNCKKLKSAWLIWKVPSLCFRGFLSLMHLCYIQCFSLFSIVKLPFLSFPHVKYLS